MSETHDLEIIVRSRITLVTIDSAEEQRVLDLLVDLGEHIQRPVYQWTVTDGLRKAESDGGYPRVSISGAGKFEANDPKQVLQVIYDVAQQKYPNHPGTYKAIGELALSKHDYAEAGKAYQAGVKKFPEDALLRRTGA